MPNNFIKLPKENKKRNEYHLDSTRGVNFECKVKTKFYEGRQQQTTTTNKLYYQRFQLFYSKNEQDYVKWQLLLGLWS